MVEMIFDDKKKQREKTVESALASVRIEGLEVSDTLKIKLKQYVNGELTIGEIMEDIKNRHNTV
jgi:hypothetical protein